MPYIIKTSDITKLKCDAIVNAANNSLLGGGGVDGAIHKAAGPELLKECKTLHGCDTGKAKITKGYNLPAKYIIHTVGPVWNGGNNGEEELLRSCYRESLKLALEYSCESIAFPLISSGAYNYPVDKALEVATDEIRKFLADHEMNITMTVFDKKMFLVKNSDISKIDEYISRNLKYPPEFYCEAPKRSKPGKGSEDSILIEKKRLNSSRKRNIDFERINGMTEVEYGYVSECYDSLPEFKTDESFSQMLLRLIDEKGLTDVEAYKKSNIDKKLFSKIKSNINYKPKKETVYAFVFGLQLGLNDAEELLHKAGYSISDSILSDVIIKYFIENKKYDIFEVNNTLYFYDQKLLGNVAS